MAPKKDLRKELPVTAHLLPVPEVYALHGTSPEGGLTSAQVLELRAKHGSNCLTPPVTKSLLRLYIDQYLNFFSLLLMAGGVLCFIAYGIDQSDLSNLYLGIVLEVVVIASSTFGFMQEAKSNAIMQGFKKMVPKKCKVMRDGSGIVLDASELVPGDLVEFQEGDQVPADLRVVASYNLKVDNSSLTGESEACERGPDLLVDDHGGSAAESGAANGGHQRQVAAIEATNLIFYSTIVVSGHGKGVVIGTGDNTVMGQIAGLAGEAPSDPKAPIQHEVDNFIFIISAIAITLGVTFLSVGVGLGVQTAVQSLVFCISVIVATVPEGLLVTLTVALALTAKRMHSKNVLVKNLNSVETLGCTQVIASDKTGTLTQNRMTVQHAWYDGEVFDVPAPRNFHQYREMMSEAARQQRGPQGWRKYDPSAPTLKMLQRIATLCNNSDLVLAAGEGALLDLAVECEKANFDMLSLGCTGDASESGLVKFVQILRDAKEYRKTFPKLFEIKFNSTNKWQLSIHDRRAGDSAPDAPPLLLLKGAPERVIQRCSRVLVNGEEVPLDGEWMKKFQAAYDEMGGLGERVLGFAYRNLDGLTNDYKFTEEKNGTVTNFPTEQLTFAGLLSLMDPPREGVPEAVAKCMAASVKVFMVTGDHPVTAKAIAKQVGIVNQQSLDSGRACVVTGDDLRDVMEITNDKERERAWDRILAHEEIVFARVTPAHKLLIVENNQRLGRIVAVTGDGVNDAPALNKADIGVSMGIAGKDVSKEAADMILMDDNFASIVNGVEEGRLIFDNLKKSICYTLSSKPPELIPFLLWVSARFPLAISTILILAVDLGTDMVPAISLAYETREADIMSKPPRNAQYDRLVDGRLLLFTYFHYGVLQALAGFYAFVVVLNDYGYNPSTLMGMGLGWEKAPMICTVKDGRADSCGFGCGGPKADARARLRDAMLPEYPAQASSLTKSFDSQYCKDGCVVPSASSPWDPFSEFTPMGYRGHAAGTEAVCARTCAWWRGLGDMAATYLAAAADPSSPLRYILTPDDNTAFQQLCDLDGSEHFGFPGRGGAGYVVNAPVGGMYYWKAAMQALPNIKYARRALHRGQSAYFFAVVLCKGMCVVLSKTRKVSIFEQGLRNNRFLLFAILFELSLAILIVYVPPLNIVFNTDGIWPVHLLLGFPWLVLMFVYDELRKWAIRRWPGGFVDTATFY